MFHINLDYLDYCSGRCLVMANVVFNVPIELVLVLIIVGVVLSWLVLKFITRIFLLWRYKKENDKSHKDNFPTRRDGRTGIDGIAPKVDGDAGFGEFERYRFVPPTIAVGSGENSIGDRTSGNRLRKFFRRR